MAWPRRASVPPSPAAGQPRRSSLRRTWLSGLALLFGLMALGLFGGVRGYARHEADRSFDQLLQASALSMADSVTQVQGQWRVDLPYAALDLLSMAPQDRAYYRIVAPDGQTLTGYADLPSPAGGPDRHAADLAPVADGIPQFFDADYRQQRVRFVRVPRHIAAPGGRGAGPVWVEVGQTRQARDELAATIVWRATLIVGGVLLALFALLALGVHLALRPLERLRRELDGRSAADLQPLRSAVPDELGPLLAALNDFMARLAVNLDALRTFIAEAAHQMRTPLAALIAQAQDGLDEHDPQQQRRSLLAVERNALRLRRLLNQLLSDASVAHQGHLQRFQRVDLLPLLLEAVLDVVPRAEPQPEVRLSCRTASTAVPQLLYTTPAEAERPRTGRPGDWRAGWPQAWVCGDALMLREAFKNLIDNALKYGRPQAGAIELCVAAAQDPAGQGVWRLSVSDHGPGVAPDRRDALFQRFVRGADARAADAEPARAGAGAGLGLSIAQRVLAAHRGQVALRDRPDGGSGLVVQLELPAADPAAPTDGRVSDGGRDAA